ncbi:MULTISPECIES: ATP-NAD kinase family protein [unclassified Mesorhizobium]|uniref:ATP-NAD kinase family protein n=1 Tax=unclassified Mesorhizobium TaxID=325217 RepID=UPI00241526C1|nr:MULTISPECIES: ATP-NAD kinase family protein [unclassified Mesorhizobium]MDG4890103.1 ATP-NAD kinase family protein [Mesorhizobium sp. WSM4887]MDG4904245.1 ATP-NAD kinase family protein [Mesorhizobium sp. WSM4962]MDG4909272.1 ATP-NAD kinase family protein [Mesorhizobium sp. WSM4898]MDG4921896.1 ATP-NAD kinase family protein [Mesorhizobium sp. WSM4989]
MFDHLGRISTMRIGLIINPVAGMGGSVGLKGTDGDAMLKRAQELGAARIAAKRALRALRILADANLPVRFLAPGGEMGGDTLAASGLISDLFELGSGFSPGSTKAAAQKLLEAHVDLLVFAGGDGTARDILEVIGRELPVIGIPAGVKMHSGVFALTPEAAGRLLVDLAIQDSARRDFDEAEVMDIDEDLLRAGHLNARLFGYMNVPRVRGLVQTAKSSGFSTDDLQLRLLGREIAGEMEPAVTYLIGPGTTAKRPLDAMGLGGTLLGVDAVRDRQLVGTDLTSDQAISLARQGPVGVIVGITGGQGFVCGRGNQQIGPDLIRKVWPHRFTMLAGAEKLQKLRRPELILDTGCAELDAGMRGYARVRTGPKRSMIMQLV